MAQLDIAERRLPQDGRARINLLGRRVDLLTPRALHPRLAEPIADDLAVWFAAMDRHGDVPFLPEGRERPPMPEDEVADGMRDGTPSAPATTADWRSSPRMLG